MKKAIRECVHDNGAKAIVNSRINGVFSVFFLFCRLVALFSLLTNSGHCLAFYLNCEFLILNCLSGNELNERYIRTES